MTRPAPRVAAIVLTWNRREEVLQTVGLLRADPYPGLEVIVVDNASTDGTRAALAARYPDVRVIALPRNIGISGRDVAIRQTGAEYVACFDDDSAPDPGALARMMHAFAADPRLGILAFDIYGGAFTTAGWARARPDDLVGYISCGVGLHRAAVVAAGFSDPDFFVYAEEFDLAIRVLARGYTIAFDPAIRARHRTSALNRSPRRMRTLTTRNETWMVLKYFPAARIPVLIARVLFWNASQCRSEGLPTLGYAARGTLAALLRARVAWRKRQAIPSAILARYEAHYWSFRPLVAALRGLPGRAGRPRERTALR